MNGRCKERVYDGSLFFGGRVCRRKDWKDGFCQQHHPDSAQKRRVEAEARYQAKRAQEHAKWARLQQQREDAGRFAALCDKPGLFHDVWQVWDGTSDFRQAFDAALVAFNARVRAAPASEPTQQTEAQP